MLKTVFAPNHFVHDADVGLDYADYFRGDVFIDIIGNGDAWAVVLYQFDCNVNALQEALGVDAAQDETTFVEGFGTFSAGADADSREGMADAGEEAALFWKGATVAYYGKCIHLKAVVVVEAKRLVLYDALVQLEATCLKSLSATRMAAVEDGHVVLLRHLVDGIEEREEVLLRVDVLFAMGGKKNIILLFQVESGEFRVESLW